MINRVVILRKSLNFKYFATFASDGNDPYYILGVQKNAEIEDVKKAFYKLANQYHPDKVQNSSEGTKKFLLIKQAYQAIKMQKGIIKPSGFVYDTDSKSMRPDPSRFETDDQENRKSQADYRMYQQKAEAGGEEFERFKGTFKTVNDINDIKIRVEKGQMKDSTKRFNLDNLKVNIKMYSNDSFKFYFFVAFSCIMFYLYQKKLYVFNEQKDLDRAISIQEQRLSEKKVFDQDDIDKETILKQFSKDEQAKQYIIGRKTQKKRETNFITQNISQVATGQDSA